MVKQIEFSLLIEGSNPSLPTKKRKLFVNTVQLDQLVDHKPATFEVGGSIPSLCNKSNKRIVLFTLYCGMEQMVACDAHNVKVGGSSPSPATKKKKN